MKPLPFKFHFWDGTRSTTILAKKGEVRRDGLLLDGGLLAIGDMTGSTAEGKFLTIDYVSESKPERIVLRTFQAPSIQTKLIKMSSAVRVDRRKQELDAKGAGNRFRAFECPTCESILDMTDIKVTPQVYCHHCETITTTDDSITARRLPDTNKSEIDFGICKECGLYSDPKLFTELYFYFFFVVWGFQSNEIRVCSGCMRGRVWAMFFANFVFVLGLPNAIYQLIRVYWGGRDRRFPGLNTANANARENKLEAAVHGYQRILRDHPTSAGIKYNIATAFLKSERTEEAARMMEHALADCSNFAPAVSVLQSCYRSNGETEKLDELNAVWRRMSQNFL